VDGLSCYDCPAPFARPTSRSTYRVTLVDEDGCIISDDIVISVDQSRNVYIPNAFSPNGDGVNDDFRIFADAKVKTIRSLKIFDRWGENLFSISDMAPDAPDAAWDGRHRGQYVGAGVYVYFAEVVFFDGHIETLIGEVVIVR
jgi:gliding motility-associated-like protein